MPHPKTLTMAGDYEYFSARGHHPFAFALAELVDNALRATKGMNAPSSSNNRTLAHAANAVELGAAAPPATAGSGEAAAGGAAGGSGAGSNPSREITISLVVNEKGTAGLIRVQVG